MMIILGRTFSGLHCLFDYDYDYAHEHAHDKYRSGNRTACFGPNAERRSVRIAALQASGFRFIRMYAINL
jgi:hypothetical protein